MWQKISQNFKWSLRLLIMYPQLDATTVHDTFKAPYTLQKGLEQILQYDFINPRKMMFCFLVNKHLVI